MKNAIFWLAGVALVTRLAIIDWTLPYVGNPTHEHSMFYDSQAVVHDQYRALFAIYHFPKGLVDDALGAAWPLLQRYLAAPPLLIWLAAEHGFNVQRVLDAPYVETAAKTLLINRLISVIASAISILLTWKLLRRFLSGGLAFFLTAIFALSVSEIGLSIHEKTVSLLTVMYLIEALCLERWAALPKKRYAYLVWAFVFVGLAGTAREYGLLFGGLLAACVVVFVLSRRSIRFLFSWHGLALLIAIIGGITIGSPDMLVKIAYWAQAVLEPGGRAWHSTTFATIPQEMWAVGKLLFGGNIGGAMFIAAGIYVAAMFRKTIPFFRALLVWILIYLIIIALYPLKDLRFIAGLASFSFLIIGLFLQNAYTSLRQKLSAFILTLWFCEVLLWSISALVFFNGKDTRLTAAENFNAVIPTGTSVGTFYPPYYNRQIPVDEHKFKQFTYDIHSPFPQMRFIPNGRDAEVGESGIWPEYILIDYETDGYTYPSDQVTTHKFRDSILASGRYQLIRFYPKRTWQLGKYGLFGTRSRWLYLNPVVEVYKIKP